MTFSSEWMYVWIKAETEYSQANFVLFLKKKHSVFTFGGVVWRKSLKRIPKKFAKNSMTDLVQFTVNYPSWTAVVQLPFSPFVPSVYIGFFVMPCTTVFNSLENVVFQHKSNTIRFNFFCVWNTKTNEMLLFVLPQKWVKSIYHGKRSQLLIVVVVVVGEFNFAIPQFYWCWTFQFAIIPGKT